METNEHKENEKTQKVNIDLKNLGTINKNKVIIRVNGKGTLVLFFSYETIVSFCLNTPSKHMDETIQNYWSDTTGKLLNECEPDKNKRLDENSFNKALTEAFILLF